MQLLTMVLPPIINKRIKYLLKKVNRLNKAVQEDIGKGKVFEKVKTKFMRLQKARKELAQAEKEQVN